MLAINHATLATGVTFGLSIYLNEPFFLPFIAFVVLGSLMPDIDHSNSEISQHFPLIGKFIKHRGPTHSILGIAAFFGIFYLLLGFNKTLSFILILFALIGVNFLSEIIFKKISKTQKNFKLIFSKKQSRFFLRIINIILNIFLVALIFLIWKERFREEILVLLSLGYSLHILGDLLTKEGVPLLWPLKNRFGFKLFCTNSGWEKFFGFILVFVNIYLVWIFADHFNVFGTEYWKNYLNL